MPLVNTTPYAIEPVVFGWEDSTALNVTISNGKQEFTYNGGVVSSKVLTSAFVSSGKYYFEGVNTGNSGPGDVSIGVGTTNAASIFSPAPGKTLVYYPFNGNIYEDGGAVVNVGGVAHGFRMGIAYDADAGTLSIYDTGGLKGSYTWTPGAAVGPIGGGDLSVDFHKMNVDWEAGDWVFTAPPGFVSWTTA